MRELIIDDRAFVVAVASETVSIPLEPANRAMPQLKLLAIAVDGQRAEAIVHPGEALEVTIEFPPPQAVGRRSPPPISKPKLVARPTAAPALVSAPATRRPPLPIDTLKDEPQGP